MDALLERLQDEMDATLRPLGVAQTQRRLGDDPGRWTIQQTVEHLMLTYSLSAGAIEERLAKGRATQARPSAGQWIGQFVVLRLGRFPKGRKSPEMALPADMEASRSGVELAGSVRELLTRFDGLATEAERVFGTARAISHPVLGPLSVMQWRQFHLVHGEHHLRLIAPFAAASS